MGAAIAMEIDPESAPMLASVADIGAAEMVAASSPTPRRAIPGNGARGGKPLARCCTEPSIPGSGMLAPALAPSSSNTANATKCSTLALAVNVAACEPIALIAFHSARPPIPIPNVPPVASEVNPVPAAGAPVNVENAKPKTPAGCLVLLAAVATTPSAPVPGVARETGPVPASNDATAAPDILMYAMHLYTVDALNVAVIVVLPEAQFCL